MNTGMCPARVSAMWVFPATIPHCTFHEALRRIHPSPVEENSPLFIPSVQHLLVPGSTHSTWYKHGETSAHSKPTREGGLSPPLDR